MRKIFTLALSAIVAFSASAFDLKERPLRQLDSQKTEQTKKAKKDGLRVITSMKKISNKKITDSDIVKAPVTTDNATASDLAGTWLFDLGDYYFQTSVGPMQAYFEATVNGTTVMFEDPTGYELPFIGTFDAATSELTFDVEFLGTASGYYINQEPFVYNYDTNDLDVQPIVAKYNALTDKLVFQSDNGISWAAYTNQQLTPTSLAGYFSIYDLEGAAKLEGGIPEPEPVDEIQEGKWETVGMATFVDAWILPSYSLGGVQINPNEHAYEVELQKNVDDENIYRLWKPYKSAGALVYEQGLNQSTFDGQIVFDLSDPDNVAAMCTGLPAGFKNSNGEFYMSNLLGWYVNYLGGDYSVDKADYNDVKSYIISVLFDPTDPEAEIPDTFKEMTSEEINALFDGAVTVEDSRKVITINNTMFDFSSACDDGYSWNNNPYSAYIIFPAEPVEEPAVGNISGNMIGYVDMNQGMAEEPDLVKDPDTFEVTASYDEETNALTIYNFADANPITFTVNVEEGTAVAAANQVAYVEEGITYYYASVATHGEVKAELANDGENLTVKVEPFGEGADFGADFGWFNSVAYYNSEITLVDFNIEGLPVPSVDPEEPKGNPFAPKGDEEVVGEIQFLHNPGKTKAPVLSGAELGAPEGWSVAYAGTENKNVESSNSITIDGTSYVSMKLNNGGLHIVTLPEGYVANAVWIYSVTNTEGATDRPCYWAEVDGVTYDKPDYDYLDSYKDFANPAISYFKLSGGNSFTLKNSGEQQLIVLKVDYSVAGEEPDPDDPVDPQPGEHTYDFSAWSAETVANLMADTTAWSDIEKADATEPTEASKDNCFWMVGSNVAVGANGYLYADGKVIEELKGLDFSTAPTTRNLAIAVNYPEAVISGNTQTYKGGAYLWLGGSGKDYFVMHNVEPGTTIKMGVESHNNTNARGVELYTYVNGEKVTKLLGADGSEVTPPTLYAEQEWAVPGVSGDAPVDIMVYNTNGCHLYFIDVVTAEGPETGIADVITDADSDAIYFNLQGVRVQNPAAGAIYIRVQGDKVNKVVIR